MVARREVVLTVDNIGSVVFRKNPRARHLSIRIKPFAGVCVTVPRGVTLKQAERFVDQKRAWIAKSLRKARELEQPDIVYDGTTTLHTRRHRLEVEAADLSEVEARLLPDRIRVRYPLRLPLTHADVQAAIRFGITEAYRQEAKALLPGRVAELARLHGFEYRRVFIRNQRTRWGSCSAVNNINLNLQLMRLPDDLVDYVILHELVHTEIKNHSAAFWRRLGEVFPGSVAARKRMRAQKIPLQR